MKQFRNAWQGYCEYLDSFNCENPMKTSYLFAFYSFLIFTFVYFKNKRLVGVQSIINHSKQMREKDGKAI